MALVELSVMEQRYDAVMAVLQDGWKITEVAERLFLGPKTVETHVPRIFTKLGLEAASDVHRRVIAYLRST